jgi:glutamate-1-semialdehyde 2,1-aminomutase
LEVTTKGLPPLPAFAFDHENAKAIATLYTQLMLDQGFLASGAFYATFAHQNEHVDAALAATDRAFAQIKEAIARDSVIRELRGPIAHVGLRRR